jgi:cytidine deaminase
VIGILWFQVNGFYQPSYFTELTHLFLNMTRDFVFYDDAASLDPITQELIEHAKRATFLSYAPYSNFNVGAALLLSDGVIVQGSNQENISYPLCMCAERVALYAKASFYPLQKIKKMAVIARRGGDFVAAACCGACRQVMVEFEQRQTQDFEVIMQVESPKWLICRSASVLIPFQFEF